MKRFPRLRVSMVARAASLVVCWPGFGWAQPNAPSGEPADESPRPIDHADAEESARDGEAETESGSAVADEQADDAETVVAPSEKVDRQAEKVKPASAPSVAPTTDAESPPTPPASVPTAKPPAAASPVAEPESAATPAAAMPEESLTKIGGLLQVEYLRRDISLDELSDGTRDPLNENKISVRRARLTASHDWAWLGVAGEVELNGSENFVQPIDLEVLAQYRPDGDDSTLIGVRAGLIPVPFGFENYEQTHRARFFGEQALFTASFIPGRNDFGIGLFGNLWAINWAVAVQNGEPIGVDTFAYDDPNAAKDVVGRLQVRGDVVAALRGAFAVSLLEGRGFSAGTQPTKDTFEWRDLNEDGRVTVAELTPIPGSAGRASENFRRWAVGLDSQLKTDIPVLGETMLYAEAAIGSNIDRWIAPADPVLSGRDQRSFGWYAGLVQQLTQHFSVGARYEQYEPNLDTLQQFDGTVVVTRHQFKTLTAGVSAQTTTAGGTRGRVLLEYEYQNNSLGRNDQGLPAQLDNDTARARLEVAF